MPVITSIKPQKSKKRVNIYLDGKFGFGLDLENFVRLGLKVDQSLSENDVNNIVKKSEFQKVYDKLLRFASLRPRSEKEYREWFKKHRVHESLYEDLLDRLKRLELLSDKRFAAWWIDQRLQFKPKGKILLKLELQQKGISREIIDELLEDTQIDEENQAKNLLKRYEYKWAKLNGLEKRRKMAEFLQRRGFSWEIIREIIKTSEIEQ